ncbi:MAG: type IV pili methyl-accepting chemotaxis transducer N-terminal domain-containing protein [Proteobacteria bacterium]|nr:type IV pili methyl-accepting chemotaxis transducer N-terminal domain-containing protein [Pseudomonadota bacterium]
MDRFQFCAGLLGGAALAALPATAFPQAAPAQRLDVARATDMAGRLRMLSQRCTKAYLQWGQSIASEKARTLLRESIALYEAHLATLKGFQPNPAVQASLPQLHTLWSQFKALLIGEPNRTGAASLYDANESLQSAAHYLTVSYANTTGSALEHLLGLAGRQRMLSQRMAKFFFYRTWELFEAPADMELHLSRAHFTAVLTQLETSLHANPAVQAAATRMRRAWEPHQQALFASKDITVMRANAEQVAEGSERVLAAAEEVVALLVAQAQTKPA